MRTSVRLGLVLATAGTLAACGSIAAPAAAPQHPAHSAEPRLARSRSAPPAGGAASAAALAGRILSRLPLPARAHRLPSEPVPRAVREPDDCEGRLVVECDSERVAAGPGDVVRVPRGRAAYCSAPDYARMLFIYGPNPDGAPSKDLPPRPQ
ncbi:MAG: hypothetical protein ACRDPO_17335 [Streptosporangiaceae bacterium]